MQSRTAAAAALVMVGLAGCSSPPSSAPAVPPGALPGGSALVTIDDSKMITSRVVSCLPIGSWMRITIGDAAAGVLITVDTTNELIAKSVAFNDFGGFTGSYWHDLQGSARVGVVDQTYAVTGTARGFNGDNPSLSTQERFTVNVAC
jgi:hypothetical protein